MFFFIPLNQIPPPLDVQTNKTIFAAPGLGRYHSSDIRHQTSDLISLFSFHFPIPLCIFEG